MNTVDERARLHGAEAIQLDVLSSNVEALALLPAPWIPRDGTCPGEAPLI
jgi:hypothetical protein